MRTVVGARVGRRSAAWAAGVGLAVLGLVWFARAADAPPLDRPSLDRRVYDVLREVHNQGADLYNAGDPAGCYRMFQGAMITVRPLLDHRPEQQKFITSKL